MSKEKTSNNGRVRNWTVIVYPESAPSNWRDIIDEWHIEWVESPLHDKDINADGEPKKPHYHVLLMFGGLKSYEQVLELIQPLNCPIPKKCHNAKSLVRYMVHLDNPEKAQYRQEDICAHGGVEISDLLKPTAAERYTLIKEMIEFVRNENIIEMQDLVDYAMFNRFDDWFPLLCDNSALVMDRYIKSARHRSTRSIDYETGECLGGVDDL